MVAAGFGGEITLAAGAGLAIGGQPVAEAGLAAHELAPRLGGVVPLGGPLAVDQLSHCCSFPVILSSACSDQIPLAACGCGAGPEIMALQRHDKAAPGRQIV